MGNRLLEYELRDLLSDALKSKSQPVMDTVLVTLVQLGHTPEEIGPKLVDLLEEMPDDVRAFWNEPCDRCGFAHLPESS